MSLAVVVVWEAVCSAVAVQSGQTSSLPEPSPDVAEVIVVTAQRRPAEPTEVEARFQSLVQSPLRAALLRFLCARP